MLNVPFIPYKRVSANSNILTDQLHYFESEFPHHNSKSVEVFSTLGVTLTKIQTSC